MKSATRVLAAIAAGGVMTGGAAALVQVSAPKTATTAAVSTSNGSASGQAIQQLADESAQLHAAVAAAQAQLTNLRSDAAGATASSADPGALLAQTQAQLAAAQQRLAADEALLAKLQPKGRTTMPTPTPVRDDAARPAPAPATTTAPQAVTVPPPPPVRHTYSPSARPTNGAGDD